MSDLPGDCFAYGGERIGVRAALDLLRARVAPVVGREAVPLEAAAGRVLADRIIASRDVPAFDNVAVDGWAFAVGDGAVSDARWLEIAPGRAAAGHPHHGEVPAGACLRALTGAPMPTGTDTVALQEEVEVDGLRARVPAGLKRGANRRRRGEDMAAGAVALKPGTVLEPRHVGVAAEVGCPTLPVFRRLRVALFSTGDELVAPGGEFRAGTVFDANRPILRASLAGLPVEVSDLGILPDRADAVREALEAASRGHDLLLTSGGASRGDEDHVARMVATGGRLDFWQIAMKPGRPLAFGRLGRAVFLGLPGNPVATMVCFLMFARPVILRLAGADWLEPRRYPVRAGFSLKKRPGRTELVRARLGSGDDGSPLALRVQRQGSGVLTTMIEADGLVELDADGSGVEEGALVPFLSFTELAHAVSSTPTEPG